jgi:probable rRNA maturation factor
MILLDPDLDRSATLSRSRPDPVPRLARPTPSASRLTRVPSARSLARFLAEAQAAVRLRGQVTVLLTTDAAIRKLNRQFRGIHKPTDVLSFPAADQVSGEVAGDLAISIPIATRQAQEQGHALSIEVKVLILHGLLHLAGYDHEGDEGQMARRERVLRGRLGLPQGLIERASVGPIGARRSTKR